MLNNFYLKVNPIFFYRIHAVFSKHENNFVNTKGNKSVNNNNNIKRKLYFYNFAPYLKQFSKKKKKVK